jgi:hypothetical protein
LGSVASVSRRARTSASCRVDSKLLFSSASRKD